MKPKIIPQEIPDTKEWINLHCNQCGKPVSSPIPKGTIVRAFIQCPECVMREGKEKQQESE